MIPLYGRSPRFQYPQLDSPHLSPSRRDAGEVSLEYASLTHQWSTQMTILTLQIFGTVALFVGHLFVVVRNRFTR
jgi:hypothetical protein